ncbi:MAG TPA: helicase C-terminal domain-containing protein [Vicinamibacterales bacterium]|nr:helicase C-terminal domain-containing protein [Vicinamibacterales bacterium]
MPEVPAVPRSPELTAAVDAVFAPGGPLSCALEGFEARPAQLEMAAAVADVFAEGGVLLAEAGTGTGKTLAYLVPAILSRQRVLISTGTKNLQEQIFFKDLPVLKDTLGIPFTATYMKGRGNYLCLHKFAALKNGPAIHSREEAIAIECIDEWSRETETGDRAEMDDLPEDLPFWPDIAATSENCIGADCPQFNDCFVTKMRQRAAESDVVIVNHHLLCADASVRQSAFGEVIPSCRYAIVDEAHQLEDVATQYFGRAVSNYRFDDFARDVDRAISSKQIADRDHADALHNDIDNVRDGARLFFGTLQMLRFDQKTGAESRIRVTAPQLERVADDAVMLARALEAVEATIALTKDVSEDVLALGRRAQELRDDVTFLTQADDPGHVYYLEIRGRGVFLRASPIDVSDIIREMLLDRMVATVLTSATLTVDGRFDYVRARLGIRRAHEARLASEFDYTRQAILYLPKKMPDPRSPEFVAAAGREVVEILKRTDGRAFVLFTSYNNLRQVHEFASTRVPYPMLVQGSAPRTALLRDFKATPNAVLFATSSFWQGVDVVGESLSCVIIDKLPFASPGDPITSARIEAINNEGGNAFGEYQIPLAILALQQGLGRLIRHRQDRGVLAVLDPRLRTMGYGRRFLASLPPAPVTNDIESIDKFFDA